MQKQVPILKVGTCFLLAELGEIDGRFGMGELRGGAGDGERSDARP